MAAKVITDDLRKSIESPEAKSNLHHTSTVLKGQQVDKDEFARDQAVKGVYKNVTSEAAAFDATKLKHTEIEEKNQLPTKEDLASARKEKHEHLSGITNFAKDQLNHVDPQVKQVTPDAEEFKKDQEMKQAYKTIKNEAAHFDQAKLKPVEPVVKHDPIMG